ncbi:MAG: hypothetical protein ACD_76C00021G0003 [uncultured bacterium]|nr:MAG: hypothetical protein ACD_76C00021G0003 [uncultured bacterium]HBD05052.1 hypothetical protein [Candidatus Uhrbacteria bacterium]
MRPSKIRIIALGYKTLLDDMRITAKEYPNDRTLSGNGVEALQHCRHVVDEILVCVDAGYLGKAYRMLGFVQGVLWAQSIIDLNDIRHTNRSRR